MVDDLGPAVCVKTRAEVTDLRARLRRRQVDVVDAPAGATTLVVDEYALDLIDAVDSSVTVVCLLTNRWSPLHWADGGSRGPAVRLTEVRRRVERHGRSSRTLGVFRSTTRPLALIGFDTPEAARMTVSALGVHVAGWRRHVLVTAVRFPTIGRWMSPGWLLIAPGTGRKPTLDPTGQIGYEQSEGCTRVLGEPPRLIEREAAVDDLIAEAAVLDELGASSIAPLVPHVIRAPGRDESRPGARAPSLVTSLIPGRPLRPRQMTDQEIERWTERAAHVLDELQSTTLDEDGSVLVHGDYWLGNLLVDDDQIVGIIDWESAHRGQTTEDREFLARSLTTYLDRDQDFADRLEAIVRAGSSG